MYSFLIVKLFRELTHLQTNKAKCNEKNVFHKVIILLLVTYFYVHLSLDGVIITENLKAIENKMQYNTEAWKLRYVPFPIICNLK